MGMGLARQDAQTWVSVTLIFLSAMATGLGWYDNLGKFAGAGSIIPITGFANGVVASAIEFKKEGFIGTRSQAFYNRRAGDPVRIAGIFRGRADLFPDISIGRLTYEVSSYRFTEHRV